ncbi:hypothetical protein ACQPZJ_35520 [Actinoplanes sp. CA-054009]
MLSHDNAVPGVQVRFRGMKGLVSQKGIHGIFVRFDGYELDNYFTYGELNVLEVVKDQPKEWTPDRELTVNERGALELIDTDTRCRLKHLEPWELIRLVEFHRNR